MADRQDVHQRGGLRMGVGQGSGGKTGQKYLIWWRMVAQVGEFTLAVLLSHLTRTVSALLQFELWDYNTSGAAGIGGIRTRGFLNARKYLPPPIAMARMADTALHMGIACPPQPRGEQI